MTKPPATAKPIEQSVLPLMTYSSPPRMSATVRGASCEVTTRTLSAPLRPANASASSRAPGAAVTTTELVSTSTYQEWTASAAFPARASSARRSAVRSAWLCATTTGVAPPLRIAATSPRSVVATVSRAAPSAIHAPAQDDPSRSCSVPATTGAPASSAIRARIWPASRPRSRFIAATRPGSMPRPGSGREAPSAARPSAGDAVAVGATSGLSPSTVAASEARPRVTRLDMDLDMDLDMGDLLQSPRERLVN